MKHSQQLASRGRRAPGKAVLCAGIVGLLAILSGCAREVATTTIKPDGSWTRHVVIHTPKIDKNAPNLVDIKPEDVFVLPDGPNWKITKSEQGDDATYTAQRSVAVGETLSGDISVKRDMEKSVAVVNQVTVKQTAPGKFVYTETFTWKGEKPKELLTPDADMVSEIKKALPPRLATDANARTLTLPVSRAFWHVMFGPGNPLVSNISQMMMEPEITERRIEKRIGPEMEQLLADKLAAQLTPAERKTVTRKFIRSLLASTNSKSQNAGPGGGGGNSKSPGNIQPIALSIFLKAPGKIIQTNGEADNDTGEVTWSLYPQAAALGDVTLTATCETK